MAHRTVAADRSDRGLIAPHHGSRAKLDGSANEWLEEVVELEGDKYRVTAKHVADAAETEQKDFHYRIHVEHIEG